MKFIRNALIFIMLITTASLFAQVDFEALNAEENFREGIIRFHRGSYNEAILAFQRSLSFVPGDQLVREWLGRAYYFSGYEEAALGEWQEIEAEGDASPALRAFIDHILSRQSLASELEEDRGFLIVESFEESEYTKALDYPVSVIPDGHGRWYVASFADNSIQLFDQSGKFLDALGGGFQPMSGPFDVYLDDDRLLVSNFLGDFVSVITMDGNTETTFGEAGIGEGQLLGPQYLAVDGDGSIYVGDYGNQRIAKFASDGSFLMNFGAPAAFRSTASVFEGFTRIAGIHVMGDGLYAADNTGTSSVIRKFDFNGNILENFELDELRDIEDLGPAGDDGIMITTRTAVYRFDPVSLELRLLYRGLANSNSQFLSATFDDNGNLLISDFRNQVVHFLSRLSGIYSGYQVEILRIDSSEFPRLNIEVSVRDVLGNEVLGLARNNFLVTEDGQSLGSWQLSYSGSFDDFSSVAVIFESSARRSDAEFRALQQEAMGRIAESLPAGTVLRMVSAGISPVLEMDKGGSPGEIPTILNSMPADEQWRLDQAIRLSGDRLLLDQNKREIVFVGSGSVPDWAFSSIGVVETLAYLVNNHIRFNVVLASYMNEVDPTLQYLVDGSGGSVYTLDDSRGLADMGTAMLDRRTGIYLLNTESLFDPDFGRKYLPIEVEVSHFTKSGRDESGYFAPLEF